MFWNCLCSSISLENSRVYFPFLFTDCLQWSSIPMILGSAFLDVAVIRHDRTILRDQCVFPNDQNKDIKNSVSFVLSASVATDKSNCWRFETVLVFIFGLESFVVVYKIKLWFNFVDYDKLFFWNYYLRSIFIRDRSFITSQWGGGGEGGEVQGSKVYQNFTPPK